jgi:hypothetical protein
MLTGVDTIGVDAIVLFAGLMKYASKGMDVPWPFMQGNPMNTAITAIATATITRKDAPFAVIICHD